VVTAAISMCKFNRIAKRTCWADAECMHRRHSQYGALQSHHISPAVDPMQFGNEFEMDDCIGCRPEILDDDDSQHEGELAQHEAYHMSMTCLPAMQQRLHHIPQTAASKI
jgi:hypothetical protein